METAIVAMTDHGHTYDYPPAVRLQINDQNLAEYGAPPTSSMKGIFKSRVCSMSSAYSGAMPAIHHGAALAAEHADHHDASHSPCGTKAGAAQRSERNRRSFIDRHCHGGEGEDPARTVYGVPAEKIEVIPHGIPDFPFVEPDAAKARLGFDHKPIILTFGLLSPNKGIEVMIDAMPSILKRVPMRFMSCWARPIRTSFGVKARPTARAWLLARVRSG
jgi:glycosyltransferase involved in cell wall biosynthesis